MKPMLYLGRNPLHTRSGPVQGRSVTVHGEPYHAIVHYDRMRPFFLTLVSSSDHWMFLSSTGALTAGRQNPDLALFPYYPEDKIHDSVDITGSRTVMFARRGHRDCLWEPFSLRGQGIYRLRRTLLKSTWGNQLIFEEANEDLALTFRYGWFPSHRFGFVRRAWLTNTGRAPARIRLVDGLQNLMPCGAGSQFQLDKSNLLDAYRKNELIPSTGLGLFRLSSIPIDRPEPAESLRTTTAWSVGLPGAARWVSARQLEGFRRGEPGREETDVRAERGAYFLQADLALRPGQTADWLIVADVGRGPSEVAELNEALRRPSRLRRLVLADVEQGTDELRRLVASADGLQQTAQPLRDARHYHNVLFNVMRGGVFSEGYQVDPLDLRHRVEHADRRLAARQAKFFRHLGRRVHYARLVAAAVESGDPQLERHCREYLPLTFSRRHGDPSRPWNRFSIAPRRADGTRVLNYEGNWRDIFQNWEALAWSFPAYLAGMVCRFLNASTADGYNPYRLTRDGIDWEVVNPADPWAHIGYWGDHQVIYLLKLLELLQRHEPDTLREFLTREIFAYANVPYRIRPYQALRRDPKETVDFDAPTEAVVRTRVEEIGADGKLLWDRRRQVRLVNLTEKLLVMILAKLANFVPGAGIWMNTQRPEWNDANNALVGHGVSMVTLAYLRRCLVFCRQAFLPLAGAEVRVSAEVNQWLARTRGILDRNRPLLARRMSDGDRERVLGELGRAGSRYRENLYRQGLGEARSRVPVRRVLELLDAALAWADHSIRANRRPDRLYHAYNLIASDSPTELPIRRLYEMLEGQVAVLSSGRLSARESVDLLAALRRSAMYRPDQHSYVLYPDRQLPRFVEKNRIPPRDVARSPLLRRLVADGVRTLVEQDVTGQYHFNGSLRNAGDVRQALTGLGASGYASLVRRESPAVLELYERLFDHRSFTGRSGTFFGYEGLGCIYWHMVSKLLLAVQETFLRAAAEGVGTPLLRQLAGFYDDIRAGLGDAKTPEAYGAFPVDPYSHTPGHAGARQPGLTGQVKEDILCRFGELGLCVHEGRVAFQPRLLHGSEFLSEPSTFRYFDVANQARRIALPPGTLAFTYCQVPILYRRARQDRLVVSFRDGTKVRTSGLMLEATASRQLFNRTGEVLRIDVSLAPSHAAKGAKAPARAP